MAVPCRTAGAHEVSHRHQSQSDDRTVARPTGRFRRRRISKRCLCTRSASEQEDGSVCSRCKSSAIASFCVAGPSLFMQFSWPWPGCLKPSVPTISIGRKKLSWTLMCCRQRRHLARCLDGPLLADACGAVLGVHGEIKMETSMKRIVVFSRDPASSLTPRRLLAVGRPAG